MAIAVGVASALVVGLINGIAVTRLRMNPLMTTLGTWWVSQGLAFGITQGISSHSFPQSFIDLGYSAPLGITMPIWYARAGRARHMGAFQDRFGYHVYAMAGTARAHDCTASRSTA